MKYSKFLKSLSKNILKNSNPEMRHQKLKHEEELSEILVLGALDSLRLEKTFIERDLRAIEFLSSVAKYAQLSRSQIFQDLWVLWHSNFKRNGYFVEFGAVDGISLSNSYLLEKHFNWSGVVAEPNPDMWNALNKNRDCYKSPKCVHSQSFESIKFSITERPELSGVSAIAINNNDIHQEARKQSLVQDIYVETISLNDLLEEAKAPIDIDYISIDTEGSELEILSNFDFSKYDIHLFTIEHNRTLNETLLDNLLIKNGYTREFSCMSLVDGWYVKKSTSKSFFQPLQTHIFQSNKPQQENQVPQKKLPDAFQTQKLFFHEKSPKVIFDVGACYGSVTSFYREIFPNADIYSFEPVKTSYQRLENKFLNDSKVHLFNSGLADLTGFKKFNINKFAGTNSILDMDDRAPSIWGQGKLELVNSEKLKFYSLDDFISEFSIEEIDVLKLDVQGSEYLVLNGARNAIENRIIQSIYMEIIIAPTYKHQMSLAYYTSFFENAGYEIHNIFIKNQIAKVKQLDVFVVKKN